MNTKHLHSIAIIGAGFSGTAIVTQLVREAKSPLRIFLFDKANQFATGLAYSPTSNQLLLNVHTGKLGLYADQHDDFYNWLKTPHGLEAAAANGIESTIERESFLPRALYGAYLKSIFARALQDAREAQHSVHIIHATVTRVAPHSSSTGWSIHYDQNREDRQFHVDQVVLATGNESPNTLHLTSAHVQQFPNLPAKIWTTSNTNTSLQKLISAHQDKNIFLLGTGLTMADVVLELQSLGHTGHITALSRNGWLPRSHANAAAHTDWPWHNNPTSIPRTAEQLHEQLQLAISNAESKKINWRSIVDSIRPLTQSIWINLPEQEKDIFIKKHQSQWNILRHRMPRATKDTIKSLIKENKLSLVSGNIAKITTQNTHFKIDYTVKNLHCELESHLIIDCTGPNMQLRESANPLIQNMLEQKLISPGPLGLGIAVSNGHRVQSSHKSPLYTLGAPLVGELWECTAIPELRQQAHSVALQLLQSAGSNRG